MSLTQAEIAQLQRRLAELEASKRQEAMSSLTSFERFLERNGLSWLFDKFVAVINVLDWLTYIFA